MSGARNILQRVGAAPELAARERESESENEDLESVKSNSSVSRIMNMKQEGPFLVPQLWKDNLNLDNLTNDFLESNVTGEVMNLDDFLKELQVNELTGGGDMAPPATAPSPQMAPSPLRMPPHVGHGGQPGGQDDRFHNLIRPANIENLKEQLGGPAPAPRPSIMHHVGKPPDLSIKYPEHPAMSGAMPPVSLPYREAMQSNLLTPPHKDVHGHGLGPSHGGVPHHQAGPPGQGGQGGIPQASVRPLVRPQLSMASEKHEPMDPDIKPPMPKRKRKISECSNFSEDDDDDEGEEGRIGSFTSTVCVNFSEDDLRLATIPGQDFDPATRRFSEEELKPQPIIRKRKKQFVPDELKNNKYWAKRYKNNEAAKRSREARRLKENQIAMRARFLEEENNALKGEVDVLKKENSDMKQMMMALEEKLNKMSNTC